MKSPTENMTDKEHRAVTRELATRAIALQTVGAPTVSARWLEDQALSNAGIWYKAISVGNGAADWVQDTGYVFTPTLFTSVAQGEVPASGGGTANFLRADGSWAAPVASNPRVYLGSVTGAGSWNFTGLNGDAAGVTGYELVYKFVKAAATAFEIGLRFNNDSGAAKYVMAAVTGSYITVVGGGAGGTNQVAAGTVSIPVATSGAYRIAYTPSVAADDTPQTTVYSFTRGAWLDTSAITSIQVVVGSGSVDAGSVVKLFKIMEVT